MVLEDRSSCTENSNIVHVPTSIFPTAYLLAVSGVQAKVPALILSEADKATTLLVAARWQVALLDTPPTDGLAWATYESLLSASIRNYGNVFKFPKFNARCSLSTVRRAHRPEPGRGTKS